MHNGATSLQELCNNPDKKADIEAIVAEWSKEEKKRCTDETAAAFKGGGGLNSYLSGGGQSPH